MAYREVIMPAVEQWSFRPSRTQLSAIIERLREEGWLRPEGKVRADETLYLRPSAVADAMTAVPGDACLTLYMEGGPGGQYPDEWPEDQVEFSPELCEDVLIIDSPRALVLPTGDFALTLPCSACGQDLLPELMDGDHAEEQSPEQHGFRFAPAKCPSCSEALDYSQMALASEDDEIEKAPFFHFGIALTSVLPRPEPLTSVAPELLDALEKIVGIPFRSSSIEE